MRRRPLGNSVPVAINRYINSAYDNVLVVAENIESINNAAENIEYLQRYLGVYEDGSPSERPDGSPLETGDFYYSDKATYYYNADDATWTEFNPEELLTASADAVDAATRAEEAKDVAVDAEEKAFSLIGGTDIGDYEDDLTFNNITDYVVYGRGTSGIALFKVEENVDLPYTVDSTAYPHPTDDDNLRAYTSTATMYTYEETTYLTDGQVVVDATSELKNYVVYLWDSASGERDRLDVVYDYTTNNSNQIVLTDTYPVGSIVTIVFEDIGQNSDTYLKKQEAEQKYGDHNKQANRGSENSHPASAISTTSGVSVQTTVEAIKGTNELSNPNFLLPSPDDIEHPSSVATSYDAGTQLFSGVFAGDTGCTLVYVDGRVTCTAGTYEYRVQKNNGLEYIPTFTSSVADYDGLPKQVGVSHELVSGEYVITVTPEAGAVFTVKFEQGGIATSHEVGETRKTYTYETVAEMKAKGAPIGSKVQWLGYYDASDGGSNWGIVKYGSHVEDGGSIFTIDVNTYIEANLKGFRTSVLKFGARGDGGITSRETNSTAFENVIAYLESTNQVKMYVPTGRIGSKLYTLQRTLYLKSGMTLYGDGMRESFLNFPADVNGVALLGDSKLKDIGLEATLDNTKLKNAITVVGDTANRPYRVFISRVYVSNFYKVIETNWMWASVIKSVHSVNSGKGIDARGVTVNNVLKSCQLSGRSIKNDDAAVQIGDGTVATEGWMITQNLTFGFGVGLALSTCSHCAISNNIWDFCYKHGAVYSGISINNKIVNDYFGMADGATTGYYANQNGDNSQSKGNKISQSDIVAYGSLQTGLRLSQYEHNARVDKVSVDACTVASIAVEGSPRNVRVTGSNFESDNAIFGNNGQVRESLVYWNGNTGGIASSYVTIKFDDGLNVARYVSDTPSNGDYEVGDVAINRGVVNQLTHKWVCTGAGTAGVDAVFKQVDYA